MIPRRSSRSLVLLLTAAGLAVLLTACGSSPTSEGSPPSTASTTAAPAQLFPTDFEGSCQGATVSAATAYDAAAPSHKVLLFRTFEDDIVESSSALPADWQVTFDAATDAYAEVDLVACALRTDATFVQDCTGYENDGVPTENVAKLHNATYEVTVREATTGTTLATTTIATAEDTCPMFVTFESDTDTVDHYASPPDDQVVAFLKPFAQP